MLGSLAMIILFPLMGALIERFGFMSSFFGLGLLLIGMSVLFILIQKNNKREDFEWVLEIFVYFLYRFPEQFILIQEKVAYPL